MINKNRPGDNSIKRVKSEPLRAKVYAQLKEKLLWGEWKDGEKLPSESDLCKLFGVSRVTVRAAVQQLEILGLVEIRQGGGTFVRNFSSLDTTDSLQPLIQIQKHQDIITVLEYRKIIEKGTIGLAQEKIVPEDIESLEAIYKTMKQSTSDINLFSEADLAFHYCIAQISRNPMILKTYTMINEILSQAMSDIVSLLGCGDGLTYHRRIIEALKAGDKQNSENIMEEHIDITIKRVLENNICHL